MHADSHSVSLMSSGDRVFGLIEDNLDCDVRVLVYIILILHFGNSVMDANMDDDFVISRSHRGPAQRAHKSYMPRIPFRRFIKDALEFVRERLIADEVIHI